MTTSPADRRIAAALVIVGLFFASPAFAQQEEQGQGQASEAIQEIPSADPSYSILPYKWNVSFGVGNASGANPIGSIVDETEERVFTFEIDSGTLFNARVARRIWWRLGIEGEFGYSSPGIKLITTDLAGTDVQEEPFDDYSMGYGAVSVRLDLVDARITPFLLGGGAVVVGSIDGEKDVNPGFLFGGGLDFAITPTIVVRGDLKGLRSSVDAPLLSRGILVQFEEAGSALSTQFLWTIGVGIRF